MIPDVNRICFNNQDMKKVYLGTELVWPNTNMEFVDLGLSVKWAKWNVGATNPYELGGYFAWGEDSSKNTFDNRNNDYKWMIGPATPPGGNGTLLKYNNDSSNGTVDNKTILDPEDDAAYVNCNHYCRIPTPAEVEELIDPNNTTIIHDYYMDYYNGGTKHHGDSSLGPVGFVIVSKVVGYQGNTIFLPAGGVGVEAQKNNTQYAYYWTNTVDTTDCYYAKSIVTDPNVYPWELIVGRNKRYLGELIRPVKD